MPIKIYKPTTPGRRKTSVLTHEELIKKRPEKSLLQIKKGSGGRNASGKITVRHRGGGAKQFYRVIDFKRNKFDIPAKVISMEYDPNRNAYIALLSYADGEKRYIIAPQELHIGDTLMSSKKRIEIKPGNAMPLAHIPIGMMVYNVELAPAKGGQLARGAGSMIKFMALEGDYAHVKLPSGEIRMISKLCFATIGQTSNPDSRHVRIGKAGRSRHMGWRPEVRGKAMNPVDHPHGGGEGHNPVGMKHPKTPWGKPALGVKTRKGDKYSNKFIIQRREK